MMTEMEVQQQLDIEATSPRARNEVTRRLARETLERNADDIRLHDAQTVVLLAKAREEGEAELAQLREAERRYQDFIAGNVVRQAEVKENMASTIAHVERVRSGIRDELLAEKAMFEALLAGGAKQINEV